MDKSKQKSCKELVLSIKVKESKNEDVSELYLEILGFIPRISFVEKNLWHGLIDGFGHLYLEDFKGVRQICSFLFIIGQNL